MCVLLSLVSTSPDNIHFQVITYIVLMNVIDINHMSLATGKCFMAMQFGWCLTIAIVKLSCLKLPAHLLHSCCQGLALCIVHSFCSLQSYKCTYLVPKWRNYFLICSFHFLRWFSNFWASVSAVLTVICNCSLRHMTAVSVCHRQVIPCSSFIWSASVSAKMSLLRHECLNALIGVIRSLYCILLTDVYNDTCTVGYILLFNLLTDCSMCTLRSLW